MQPQLLWNAKMVIATVQRILITTVIGIVRIPQQTHGLLERVVDMHAESHVVSVRGISSTTIFIYKHRKNNIDRSHINCIYSNIIHFIF